MSDHTWFYKSRFYGYRTVDVAHFYAIAWHEADGLPTRFSFGHFGRDGVYSTGLADYDREQDLFTVGGQNWSR